uniref:Uncharacterized protein n=1 Tax=Eptatretus burgeri TaxID=7764 RepID=A0A8C4Q5Z9_EPTBU
MDRGTTRERGGCSIISEKEKCNVTLKRNSSSTTREDPSSITRENKSITVSEQVRSGTAGAKWDSNIESKREGRSTIKAKNTRSTATQWDESSVAKERERNRVTRERDKSSLRERDRSCIREREGKSLRDRDQCSTINLRGMGNTRTEKEKVITTRCKNDENQFHEKTEQRGRRGNGLNPPPSRRSIVSRAETAKPANELAQPVVAKPQRVQCILRPPTLLAPFPPPDLHVIRPIPPSPPPEKLELVGNRTDKLGREGWTFVFTKLNQCNLAVCMRVCKTWNRWCCDRRFWSSIDLSGHCRLSPEMLSGLVRRQPVALNLSRSNPSRQQLTWLLPRLPALQRLNLAHASWAALWALSQPASPMLHCLDLSWAGGLRDSHLLDLLAPCSEPRPGQIDTGSRLQSLRELSLCGADITDAVVAALATTCPLLRILDLNHCVRLTDASTQHLANTKLRDLKSLHLVGLPHLTDAAVDNLTRCHALNLVDLTACWGITPKACQRFGNLNSTKATQSSGKSEAKVMVLRGKFGR